MHNAAFGEGTGAIVLDNVNCLGSEVSLTSCSHSIPNSDAHSEDAGIRCHSCTLAILYLLKLGEIFIKL